MLLGFIVFLSEKVGEGCPGHGPIRLLPTSAAEIGFRWNPVALAWVRPGLPMLSNLAGPIQHFKAAIIDAWRNKVAADLCGREGFRGGLLLDVHGSLQLLNSSHVRERDKALLRSFLVGGVRNGFLLGRVRHQVVPCRFCGAPDGDGHLFWECTFPPLVEIRENPEFHDLVRMDEGHWPRCLLWHGWLPLLSGLFGASPWAVPVHLRVLVTLLKLRLEVTFLGWLLSGVPLVSLMESGLPPWSLINPMSGLMVALSLIGLLVFLLQVLGFFVTSQSIAGEVVGGVMLTVLVLILLLRLVGVSALFLGLFNLSRWLKMWGVICSLVLDKVTGVSSSGAGFFVHQSVSLWDDRRWGQVDLLSVVRHVGRLLDGHHGSVPFELVKDGDLLLLIERMLHLRGLDTVRVTEVEGHAGEDMVLHGRRVCEVDRFGNDAADEAADFGRRRVGNAVIDARRNLSGVCGRWYPVILDFSSVFIASSRAVVNHDGGGGTAPDPLERSAGALPKRRRLVHAVRDRAFLPGPLGIWDSEWVNIPASAICAEDIALWLYTPQVFWLSGSLS